MKRLADVDHGFLFEQMVGINRIVAGALDPGFLRKKRIHTTTASHERPEDEGRPEQGGQDE